MAAYRELAAGGLNITQYKDASKTSRYEARPTPTDFRADVDIVIKKCAYNISAFHLAYIEWDPAEVDDPIKMGKRAQHIFGGGMHNLEQGMGAEFIRRKLFLITGPVKGVRGYFNVIRQRETQKHEA